MESDLKSLLSPISQLVTKLDLTDAVKAEAELNRAYPPGSPAVEAIRAAAEAARKAGTIADRGEPNMKFSRVVKPKDDVAGCSIDAVYMHDSSGPVHTHTLGEVCLCIPAEGTPLFEGRDATWIVMPAGSRHVPTVKGGAMLILYWWPQGAVEWS
jgi:hypothetical protein